MATLLAFASALASAAAAAPWTCTECCKAWVVFASAGSNIHRRLNGDLGYLLRSLGLGLDDSRLRCCLFRKPVGFGLCLRCCHLNTGLRGHLPSRTPHSVGLFQCLRRTMHIDVMVVRVM